ncbi:MAG TPA: hypothetical protein VKE40_26780, partial [Gemmataceae bacterium]|nr:hypothetical protein [Gemmataceae bacterium]
MTHSLSALSAVLIVILATGCIGSRHQIPKNPPVGDRPKGPGKELAAAGSTREPALADPSTMIPPRPDMRLPEIPASPGKETDIVGAPTPLPEKPGGVVPADGIRPAPGAKDVQPAGAE